MLERLAEVALLISLFAVGMQLGVPLRDRRWRLPLHLAFVSMAMMVAMVAAIGVWVLNLPLGDGLARCRPAPTDPVLASVGAPADEPLLSSGDSGRWPTWAAANEGTLLFHLITKVVLPLCVGRTLVSAQHGLAPRWPQERRL